MNKISQQLLKAMDVVTDKKISQLEFDKTINATVDNLVNVDSGEYKVRYKGNIFSAFSDDLNKTYGVGDSVFVTVPEGNFSNKKLITGIVSSQSLSYTQQMALQNAVFEISPTFEELYGGNLYDAKKSYGVVAGAPKSSALSYNYIYKGPSSFVSSGFHGLFQQYSNKYELIRIKASFMTQLQNAHIKGNYGIEIEFYVKDGKGGTTTVPYRLDLNNFNGDPYRFSVYSPQSLIIKVQKNYLLGLKSIKLFEEDFEYDRIIENGLVTNKKNTTVANIFVKDIEIQYVDVRDLTDTKYYLMIAAPRGIALRAPNILSLDLVGRLIYQGKDIMDTKTCECQWFERDLSMMIGVEGYNKIAGFGWRPLDGNKSKITVDTNDVKHQNKYKLLVTYNKTVSLSADIEVFNQDSGYDYHIEQRTNGDEISLALVNDIDNKVLQGDWYVSYPDGKYQFLRKSNSIVVSPYLQYTSAIFYCAVYNTKNEIIGTLEHTIINTESNEDITVQYIGEDIFRYDANGDITIEDSEKERTLQVNLTWKEGFGTGYTVSWVVRQSDGTEKVLDGNDYPMQNSMIEKLWVDNYNILHYTIKQKYKIDLQNNTVIVKIATIDEKTYLFEKELLFIKDGDQGTNGTTYVIAIRPCDGNGKKLSGFNPLRYQNGSWPSSLRLKCYVYKDGELINDNPDYSIVYKWRGVNINFLSTINDRVTVNGTGTISYSQSNTCQFYVKVQTTIRDRINDRTIEVYAAYPIDVVTGNIDSSLVDISSIPSYIKYTSSGVTPLFYNNNIECKYRDKPISKSSIIPLNPNILELEERNGLQYLKPASSFIFENIKINSESNVGVLRCQLGSGLYIVHSIIMYLDTYGNEAINGWDGTALEIDEENGQYIFAPQIGAGEKDSFNRFTGVVMGKDSGQDKIGLYGYQAGLNTFGIMQNGKAYFGAKSGGGQIVIDGRYATIFGGNVTLNESTGKISPAANGMYIRLADKNPGSSTKAIGIGLATNLDESGNSRTEENFYVTYDGKVRATEANIHGNIYAEEGHIGGKNRQGGWTIQKNRLYSGSGNNHVELNSDPSTPFAIWAGKTTAGDKYSTDDQGIGTITSPADFVVTRDGFLYAKNARIKGNIEADTLTANKRGTIAGWVIAPSSITSSNGKVGMASSGNAAFWVGSGLDSSSSSAPDSQTETRFLVTRNGKLYCSGVQVSGEVIAQSGNIAGWGITGAGFENSDGSVYLSATRGLKLKDGFSVSSTGRLTATDADIQGTIHAEKGDLGGWTISSNGLSNGENIYIYSNGSMKVGDNFSVSTSGKLTVNGATVQGTITADAGRIGQWNISGGSLSAGSTILSSSGKITCNDVNIRGTIDATDLTCNHGTIGGWEISSNQLSAGSTKLGSDGLIKADYIQTNYVNIPNAGVIGYMAGSTDKYPTDGIMMGNENIYVIATTAGVRLQAGEHQFVVGEGGTLSFDHKPLTATAKWG